MTHHPSLHVCLVVLGLAAIASLSLASAAPVGHWARYRVEMAPANKLAITEVEMTILGTTRVGRADYIWWQLTAYEGEQERYSIKLLAEDLDFLKADPAPLRAARYRFSPAGGIALEYVDVNSKRALLPPCEFVRILLPHAVKGSRSLPFFTRGSYLGHPIRRVAAGIGARDRIRRARRLMLDPTLTIGTGRNSRDEYAKRMYQPGEPFPEGRPDYPLVPFSAEDYDLMIEDVGMNLFRVNADQLSHVQDRPVFFIGAVDIARLPELLYRSNYLGVRQFMDEPAIITIGQAKYRDCRTPAEAAEQFVAHVREERQRGKYSVNVMQEAIEKAGCSFGDLEFVQDNYPVWETVEASAWLQFEAGMPGFVNEGRFQPEPFAQDIRDSLGVDFPATDEAIIKFHYAWWRGAARHFNAKWGIAIYGQMDLGTAKKVFPAAYDAGAEYLWFWTCDHEHHTPFAEQIAHTRRLRAYQRAHRRPPVQKLIHGAPLAIAVPYGYLMDGWAFRHREMWNDADHLSLDMDNGHGATYGDVLKAAMQEVVAALRRGENFDLIYWREGEKYPGYREIRRVGEDAKVTVLSGSAGGRR